MAEEDGTKRGNLSRDDSLKLARQGTDAWNTWAAEHEGWDVDFSGVKFEPAPDKIIKFEGYRFPGTANFHGASFISEGDFKGATFRGIADFGQATFSGDGDFRTADFRGGVSFMSATFRGTADFRGVRFAVAANFEKATFGEDASFEAGKFDGSITFEDTKFHRAPDLRRTIMAAHLSLHGMEVSYATESRWILFWPTPDATAADKFRRLKQLAIDAKDHDRELEFLAGEYRAKRFHETNGFALIPNYLYDWLSNFGRSMVRPVVCLILFWLFAAQLMAPPSNTGLLLQARGPDALLVSAGNLLPFIGGSRAAIARKDRLFPKKKFPDGIPAWVDALGIVEGMLAAVFIFLIGLALRNRFRL